MVPVSLTADEILQINFIFNKNDMLLIFLFKVYKESPQWKKNCDLTIAMSKNTKTDSTDNNSQINLSSSASFTDTTTLYFKRRTEALSSPFRPAFSVLLRWIPTYMSYFQNSAFYKVLSSEITEQRTKG